VAEAVVTLRVDATNATTALRNVQNQTNKLSNASRGATKALHGTSTAAKGLGAALATSLGPIVSIAGAFALLNNSIGTFLARDRDIKILEQGLKNLGAGKTQLAELQEVADRFGKTTLFNEEDFTRGFNLLTSFRNIGVDAYERVAQSAADIAQVNQVDVSTSFMQLAKALQDPERNLSNLNRSGIAFSKQQTEVIKQLMKTNKVAEAHAMILDIVDESYNQLAQAAAGGFAGSVDTLGESFRDFSETLGKLLVPVIQPVVEGLTSLLNLLNTEGGQATMIIIGLTGAAKTLSLTLPLLSAAMLKVAAAGGVLTIALNAIPFVALATGAGLLTTAIIKTKNKQKELNDAIKDGASDDVAKALKQQRDEYEKIDKRLQKTTGRSKKALETKLKDIKANITALEGRNKVLEKENEITEAKKKQNEENKKVEESLKKQQEETDKLKDKMTEVGEEIESSIKRNLRESITGAQSFGQAMTNVLNKIRDKIIDAQIDKIFGNFGENFGKGASNQGGKGVGGFVGKILGGLFADGGRPPVGKASIVGERGPELFVPKVAGTIIPNNKLGGGDNTTNIVNVSVDASGSSVAGNSADAQQLGAVIGAAVQAQLIKEKRSGGLLAR
tara:strand:- start:673 stop:2523 length:1851 start_codon:yes stop_codon:yes gene_type:complete